MERMYGRVDNIISHLSDKNELNSKRIKANVIKWQVKLTINFLLGSEVLNSSQVVELFTSVIDSER